MTLRQSYFDVRLGVHAVAVSPLADVMTAVVAVVVSQHFPAQHCETVVGLVSSLHTDFG